MAPPPLSTLLEQLHRALKAQAHYAMDHPQALQTSRAAFESLSALLTLQSPLLLTVKGGCLCHQGKAIEGAPAASQALARDLEAHRIGGLVFHAGCDPDELQVLFFALQLRPARLEEIGGPDALLPEGSNLRFLDTNPPAPEAPVEDDPTEATQIFIPPGTVPEPFIPAEPEPVEEMEPAPEAPAPIQLPPLPAGPRPTTPQEVAQDLKAIFHAVLHLGGERPGPAARALWTRDQRETLEENGFHVPDFSPLSGTGAQLDLGHLDPVALRGAVRIALSDIDPLNQGNLLLGLPGFPAEEQALRRALDYLAPELLAQALAEAQLRRQPSRFALALLAVAFLQCLKDRDLALEAIRGRLQFEGWTLQDLDELQAAILWECHGTDTKLRLSLSERSLFELDAHQVMVLTRQLLRTRKLDGMRDLLSQVAEGFSSPSVARRRQASEIVADLAEALEEPGLPQESEERMLEVLQTGLRSETDEPAARWCVQGLEALLAHGLRESRFEFVYRGMLGLGEMTLSHAGHPAWKVQLIKESLGRLASPPNIAILTPLLNQRDGQVSIPQLQSLLLLFGRASADYLVACLALEELPERKGHLQTAIRHLGAAAVPRLRAALQEPALALDAVSLLGDIGHPDARPELLKLLEQHPDPALRRAAAAALVQIGPPAEAAEGLGQCLPQAPPATQLDLLALLAELRHPAAVPPVSELIRAPRGQGDEGARARLRAVEVLGLIGSPGGIPALRELFRKKGLLGGREGTAIRLAAARSLASINTREAREAIALALDEEPHEEVRAVLRQYLVQG